MHKHLRFVGFAITDQALFDTTPLRKSVPDKSAWLATEAAPASCAVSGTAIAMLTGAVIGVTVTIGSI